MAGSGCRALSAAVAATSASASFLQDCPKPLGCNRAHLICEEQRSRFEMINRDKYLESKKAQSTVYFEMAGGMQCLDVKVGKGKEATRGLLVGVHYEGYRLNGRQMESSWHRGPNPVFVEAGNSIDFPALGEGVLGMREGGRRELIVPPGMNREGVTEVLTYRVDLYAVASTPRSSPAAAAAPAKAEVTSAEKPVATFASAGQGWLCAGIVLSAAAAALLGLWRRRSGGE
eukprot:gnl/TRDRNA2_/TRDRNA2_142513_c0_seq3.p1 gnl/TRDRNA2_/TRDRNA2_142513_c0~~gnl/TRDRNA2_/TRDRNA2_142513_c0_seq3.p1  ORF type:complete len:230 (+),score=37.39 gnl/TRDRNA2_/TRDRNA2_142513_c0_seq3:64-753(+)